MGPVRSTHYVGCCCGRTVPLTPADRPSVCAGGQVFTLRLVPSAHLSATCPPCPRTVGPGRPVRGLHGQFFGVSRIASGRMPLLTFRPAISSALRHRSRPVVGGRPSSSSHRMHSASRSAASNAVALSRPPSSCRSGLSRRLSVSVSVGSSSGDVDAVWRLTQLSADLFSLRCEATRQPGPRKTPTKTG